MRASPDALHPPPSHAKGAGFRAVAGEKSGGYRLEIAAFDVASASAAARAGADRIELCAGAAEGGTTPSLGALETVLEAASVPVFAMVRPRGGDFVYDADEHAAMRRDARHLVRAGAHGLVFGALCRDGTVDEDALRAIVEIADGRPVTFHLAFDAARAPLEALEVLVRCGVARVLTSGGAETALAGRARIQALVQAAGDRLVVLPGGGVRADHVAALVRGTGAREVHSAARHPGTAAVDPGEVRRLRAALDASP
jgi:copper homeostasis protein